MKRSPPRCYHDAGTDEPNGSFKPSEIQDINNKSKLVKKYSELIDRESYEMLNKKIAVTDAEAAHQEKQKEEAKTTKPNKEQEKYYRCSR
jgi:hypothetical protein